MRKYLALFLAELQRHLQYRVSALAGAVTNIAFGFFRLFLLTAFYGASGAPQPMGLGDLYTYVWFGQVLFGVLPITGLTGGDAEEIRSGAVAYRLTRPISIYGFYYARIAGQRLSALCTRSLIQVLALVLILPLLGLGRYGMAAPHLPYLPLLVASVAATLLLSAAIQALIYMGSFWTVSTRGSATLAYAVITLFCGLLVPLDFFPPALRAIAEALPFRGVYDTPAKLYAGLLPLRPALAALAHQAAWIALLGAAGVLLARRGTARLEIAGG